ncbi:MAG: molybdenum cofactor biosynthesis protein MoaE [Alphaproteobacteria bacterium]|nr:MAG: molybdenum cofactor biosynthesis protein MoaE [Alphaproteobacteria bacterium]
MITVTVSAGPIDAEAALARFSRTHEEVGAIVHFLGVMRARSAGRALREIWLEHYPGMCERLLSERAQTIARRFAVTQLAVHHRVGRILPGETIVWVAAAAPHRREAFSAAEAMMDYLKTEAPFWKKEVALDGTSWWVAPRARDEAARRRWEEPARAGTVAAAGDS